MPEFDRPRVPVDGGPCPETTSSGGWSAPQERFGNAFFQDLTRGGAGPIPYLAEMGALFGEDFSSVRAFRGLGSRMDSLGAPAATAEESVVFRDANPSLEQVRHELAHVVQGRRFGTRPRDLSAPGDASEREADRIASGQTVSVGQAAGGWLCGDWPARRPLPPVADEPRRVSQEHDLEDPQSFPQSRRRFRLDWDANHSGITPTDSPEVGEGRAPTLRESAWAARDRLVQTDTGFPDAASMRERIQALSGEGASEADRDEAARLETQLRVIEQHAVAETLNPEQSNRYQPFVRPARVEEGVEGATTRPTTTCVNYARDYADLLGAPLPYTVDNNGLEEPGGVRELNANEMNDYLNHPDARERSGWREVPIEEAQGLANQGEVTVISSPNRNSSRPGHIGGVIGERDGQEVEGINQTMSGGRNHLENAGDLGGEEWWRDGRHDGERAGAWVYEGERQESIFDQAPESYVPPSQRARDEAQEEDPTAEPTS